MARQQNPRISELEDTSLRVLRPVLGLQGRPARPALGPVVPGLKARTFGVEARKPGGGRGQARDVRARREGRERPPGGPRRGQKGSEEAAGREPGAAPHPEARPGVPLARATVEFSVSMV